MATNFPSSLDSLTNPTSTDQLSSPSHADQHANVNDAVEALEAKVGVNGSAVATSHDYKIAELEKKQFVTLAADGQLANERVLTAGTGITVTDAGAGSTVTVATSAILPTIVDAKGDLIVGSGADAVARLAVGSNGDLLVADSSATNGVRWQGVEIAGKNKIINGNMMVAQRGTSFTSTGSANNDDTYVLDRWYIHSDGNNIIDVSQSTDAPTNGLNSIALDVTTTNKKFGIAQIIEQKNCIGLIDNTVTLSFWAKVSATTNLSNVKAAIVSWSGTADTVTSKIVSTWNSGGTTPTLIANATYENTPANLGVTTSWARYSITADVDTASTKNIVVFIWSDVTSTAGTDILYITNVQLEYGSVPTRFTMHGGGFEGELAACQRYYEKSYDIGTAPGTATGAGNVYSSYTAVTTGYIASVQTFKVRKRATPTVTTWNTDGTINQVVRFTLGGGSQGVAATNDVITECVFSVLSASGNSHSGIYFHFRAEIEL